MNSSIGGYWVLPLVWLLVLSAETKKRIVCSEGWPWFCCRSLCYHTCLWEWRFDYFQMVCLCCKTKIFCFSPLSSGIRLFENCWYLCSASCLVFFLYILLSLPGLAGELCFAIGFPLWPGQSLDVGCDPGLMKTCWSSFTWNASVLYFFHLFQKDVPHNVDGCSPIKLLWYGVF